MASIAVVLNYPPLDVSVTTPTVELRGASDALLDRLAPVVRQGLASAEPPPYDDPISLYESDPDARVAQWLQAIWRGRGRVSPDSWRLYFVVLLDGEPVGMQDLIGEQFGDFGTVVSFSWLSSAVRRRGVGREIRQAILHLAFDGLGAKEAGSDAFVDNAGSNGVSRALGYSENGTDWATRQGEPALLQRWRLTRAAWLPRRRDDIKLHGVDAAWRTLGL